MAEQPTRTRGVVGYVTRTFFQGLIALLPIVITVYLIGLLIWWLETTVGGVLTLVLPSPEEVQEIRELRAELAEEDPEALEDAPTVPVLRYVTGMGVTLAVVLIFLLGLLLKMYLVKRLYAYAEGVMTRVPLIKSIYGATKDFLGYFSAAQDSQMSQVVLVKVPGTDKKVLGLVTRETFEDLPPQFGGEQRVAVYCPMSYQIGGYTFIMRRDELEPVEMPIEDGLRFALTAGISEKRRNGPADEPPPSDPTSPRPTTSPPDVR